MAATWTALKAEIADWLDRDDLTSQIPGFIENAEARFNRTLHVPEMEQVSYSTISGGTATLPTDCLRIVSIYADDDDKVELGQVSVAELNRTYPGTRTGIPRHFALQSGSEILFGPEPDEDYTVVLNYHQKIPSLGTSQADNWLLTAHPDVYLAACLVEAYRFIRDTEGMAINDAVVRDRLIEINEQGQRKQMSRSRARLRADIPTSSASFDISRG